VQIIVFVSSLAALAFAGHFAIRAIEKLIEITGLSEVSAGFAILAVLTSTPEIAVALFSILQGTPGVSIGNVLGSNVFNIGVVLGVLALLGYLQACCTRPMLELTDALFLTALIPLLLVISYFHIIDIPSQIVGIILLVAFAGNIYLMLKKRTPPVKLDNDKKAMKGKLRVIAILVASVAVLLLAAHLVVDSGANIALFLGAPPILIGAKLVAIGTSLPELTLDLTAVRRGRVQLAIGDIIGSNLTNITLVLGLMLIGAPFAVDITVLIEILPFLLVTTIIFWRFLSRGGVTKYGGVILLLSYILFQVLLT
jgi:cation:H+ antiporter